MSVFRHFRMSCFCRLRITKPAVPHQYVQAGRLQKSNLVSDGESSETWQPLSKFHDLDDAFGGELAELVPQTQIQLNTVV